MDRSAALDVPVDAPAGATKAGGGGVWSPAAFSWSLFEFARNPYYMLVIVYIFPTYFAESVVGDRVQGSATVAAAITWAGVVVALTCPLLGLMMDKGGQRKPVMAFFLAVIAGCAVSLWWSKPGGEGLGVPVTMAVMVSAFVAYTYSELMHNAMLRSAGRPSSIPAISGMGLGLGQLSSVLCLVAFAAVALSPKTFGLDAATHEPQRFVGPFTAVWLAAFVLPFFLFMPDGAPEGGKWTRAFADCFRDDAGRLAPISRIAGIGRYIARLFRETPLPTRYLAARVVYADGIAAVLALGGVYTGAVLGWSPLEFAAYGVYASVFGVAGGFLGGVLDNWLGARRAVMVELLVLAACVTLALSVSADSLLFGLIPAGQRVLPGDMFHRLSDVAYLGMVAVLAASSVACISSSRVFLVEIAPKERVSEFFGLYAISSTATAWMGSLLYNLITTATHNPRLGFAPILGLLLAGFVLMAALVKPARAEGGASV